MVAAGWGRWVVGRAGEAGVVAGSGASAEDHRAVAGQAVDGEQVGKRCLEKTI